MGTREYLSISELTKQFNAVLKGEFPSVAFRGEISQCYVSASGHMYLSIKDEQSLISTVLWKSTVARLTFRPAEGVEVCCIGSPTIYSGSGKFQVVISRMEEAGEGLLRKRFLELKAKLEKEGFFDASRKRPLPFFPERIGIVTSKSGAAIADMMKKIRERMPSTEVYLYDARVQGRGSVEDIVEGIEYFQTNCNVEVIIVGRGGGSLEDLWSFNEEKVVRAIFSSRIPVISAVGHEVDTSLSDLAADVRAPTPTAAGEMVVPKKEELLQDVSRYQQRLLAHESWFYPYAQRVDEQEELLRRVFALRVEQHRSQLEKFRADLGNLRPDRYLSLMKNQLFECERRLREITQRQLRSSREGLQTLARQFLVHDPRQKIRVAREQVEFINQRLCSASSSFIREKQQRLGELFKVLEALNVDRVLRRGFSLVEREGCFVRSAAALVQGDEVRIRFAKGAAGASITSVMMEAESSERDKLRKEESAKKQQQSKRKLQKEVRDEGRQETLL